MAPASRTAAEVFAVWTECTTPPSAIYWREPDRRFVGSLRGLLMPNDHQNTTRQAKTNASAASMGGLRKSLARCAEKGAGLRATLGDGIVGIVLIAVLMALFVSAYYGFRRDQGKMYG